MRDRELFDHNRSVSFEGLDDEDSSSNGDRNVPIPNAPASTATNISETTAEDLGVAVTEEEAVAAAAAEGGVVSGELSVGSDLDLPPVPRRTEPTLKEKLVERERQARVETERARLKRQFALSENGGGLDDDELADGYQNDGDLSAIREHGSVVGTVGEDAIDGDDDDDDKDENENHGNIHNDSVGPLQGNTAIIGDDQKQQQQSLGYPMERFLAESTNKSANKRHEPPEPSVVMERFLHEAVVVVDDAQPGDVIVPSISTGGRQDENARNDNIVTFVIPNSSDQENSNHGDNAVANIAMENEKAEIIDDGGMLDMKAETGDDDDVGREEDVITGAASDINATVGSVRSYSTVSDDALLSNGHEDVIDPENDRAPTAVIVTTTATDDGIGVAATSSGHEISSRVENISVQSVASSQVAFQSETSDDDNTNLSQDQPPSSLSAETPPRMFRLTEREIEEMAAIEEASIGNAPPSDRDDSSLVGDDVLGDLVGVGIDLEHAAVRGDAGTTGTFSERTQTTAVESTSSNNPSTLGDAHEQSTDGDVNVNVNINIHTTASVSSHLALSPAASNDEDSITAMPPSESDRGDDHHHHHHHHRGHSRNLADVEDLSSIPETNNNIDERAHSSHHSTGIPDLEDNSEIDRMLNAEAIAAVNAGVVNRTQRPGMMINVNSPSSQRTLFAMQSTAAADSNPNAPSSMKRSSSMPLMVEGFEFDKFDNPKSTADDSWRDLPGDELWNLHSGSSESVLNMPPGEIDAASARPGAGALNRSHTTDELWCSSCGTMSISPIRKGISVNKNHLDQQGGNSDIPHSIGSTNRGISLASQGDNYGSTNIAVDDTDTELKRAATKQSEPKYDVSRQHDIENAVESEQHPLLLQVPDVVAMPPEEHSSRRRSMVTLEDLDDMVNSVFSSVRSVSTATVEEGIKESDAYLASSTLARAFPERMIALMVTLLIEIPVLLMISGGSDRLCSLIGRSKYQLLMAFLPLSSAISGNCGLQASTLTTRAISHSHVTRKSYLKWLRTEIGAALYLGLGMGTVIGSVAYIASGYDLAFGVTLFSAQVVSIFTAGCTGTLAPLLFSFIFHRDSGKWGGPLETAVQDIVGSFAMVVLSYQLLLLLGPSEVHPNDICGSIPT